MKMRMESPMFLIVAKLTHFLSNIYLKSQMTYAFNFRIFLTVQSKAMFQFRLGGCCFS